MNVDGTYNVYCQSCNQFIATTFIRFSRAICELCRRAEAGEVVPESDYERYMLAKSGKVDIGQVVVDITQREEQPGIKALKSDKFSFRTMGGNILKSLGLTSDEERKVPMSKQTAERKKRTRLFGSVSSTEEDDNK